MMGSEVPTMLPKILEYHIVYFKIESCVVG
jgi:hypothetical protein